MADPNQDIRALANMIYGEGASTDYDTMLMIGSTAVNRLKSGRAEEFGADMPGVLMKGYYAVSNPNEPFNQAVNQKFPDKKSETAFKQAFAIASGLVKGTIEPSKGQFYFTPKEETKLRKAGKKKFNFDVVRKVGETGPYNVYSY